VSLLGLGLAERSSLAFRSLAVESRVGRAAVGVGALVAFAATASSWLVTERCRRGLRLYAGALTAGLAALVGLAAFLGTGVAAHLRSDLRAALVARVANASGDAASAGLTDIDYIQTTVSVWSQKLHFLFKDFGLILSEILGLVPAFYRYSKYRSLMLEELTLFQKIISNYH